MATQGYGIPAWKVVLDSGDFFKRFIKLEKIVPALVEKKILKKKMGKHVVRENDHALLLSRMNDTMSLDGFITYLEILTDLGASEGPGGDIQRYMRTMKDSLEAMKPEPQSKLDTTIARFKATAFPELTQSAPSTGTQIEAVQTQVVETTEAIISSTSETVAETPQTIAGSLDEPSDTQTIESKPSDIEKQDNVSVVTTPQDPKTTAPIRPPPGQVGDTIAKWFTDEEGMLYSSVHGVSVLIPPNAIPSDITRYYLAMHIYFGGPFTLADGVTSCSVVAWFHQSPYFEFSKDVTVKIPHAAKINSSNATDQLHSLCVLTWEDDKKCGSVYSLSKEVPADFSDGYHAVFNVRHFCPYGTGEKKQQEHSEMPLHRTGSHTAIRKRTSSSSSSIPKRLEKMKSSSLEESFDELTTSATPSLSSYSSIRTRTDSGISSSSSCSKPEVMDVDSLASIAAAQGRVEGHSRSRISYRIVRYMPADRSGPQWEASFAACYNHPTGNWTLQLVKKFGEELCGSRVDIKHTTFHASSECLELEPQKWEDETWSVFANEISVLSINDIESVPYDSSKPEFEEMVSTKLYPPSVSYSVQCDVHLPSSQLKCTIEARGAKAANGKAPYFVLTSNSSLSPQLPVSKGEHVLFTSSYLYGEDSDIKAALNSPISDVVLDLTKPDHIKFLAEISFQLPDTKALSRALQLTDNLQDIEFKCNTMGCTDLISYKLLREWVSRKSKEAKLNVLKSVLSTIGVRDVLLKECEGKSELLGNASICEESVPNLSSSAYVSTGDCKMKHLITLSEKLFLVWWSVGTLMGIHFRYLKKVAREHPANEQSYQMIYEWQRRNGRDAKYGTLFKAMECMSNYDYDDINDALCFAQRVFC